MIIIVCTIIGTGVIVGGVITGILKGFFKTNKDAEIDHEKLRSYVDKEILQTKSDFATNLKSLEDRLEKEFKKDNSSIKDELTRIFNKIDDIKAHYVTNDNFKTYADAMNQLLMMSNERMSRMETILDDIRDNIRDDITNALTKFNKHN